jgi:hypothetical protein
MVLRWNAVLTSAHILRRTDVAMRRISALCICSMALLAGVPTAISQTRSAQHSSKAELPSTAAVERHYVIRETSIVDRQRRLIFSRCLYGQSFKAGRCSGNAEKISASEALDAKAEARLQPWRLPTASELNALLDYFLPRDDFQVPHGTPLLTSTPAMRGHRVVQFASFRDLSSGTLRSMQSDSETVPQSYILLVRPEGASDATQAAASNSNDVEQALVDYVVAIEGLRKVALQPHCSYLSIKKDLLPPAPYSALTARLSPQSRREFEAFVQSEQWTEGLKRIDLSYAQLDKDFWGSPRRQNQMRTLGGVCVRDATCCKGSFCCV